MMSEQQILLEKIKHLEGLVIKNRFLYWSGNPKIKDEVYDKIERDLAKLDPTNWLFDQIGYTVLGSSFDKVKHMIQMQSQDKLYTEEDVVRWLSDKPKEVLITTPKIDGLAMQIVYEFNDTIGKYMLMSGVTRGNSKEGEDLTENVKCIDDIPLTIEANDKWDHELKIRGEIYMSKSVFEVVSQIAMDEKGVPYKTCRSLASGSLRQKKVEVTKERNLNFFCYGAEGTNNDNYFDTLNDVASMGIPIVEMKKIEPKDIWENHLNFYAMREEINFDIDGTVLRVNDNANFESYGRTSHHPKGSTALKFETEKGITRLLDVEWAVSRTGLCNPVALIEDLELCNTTIKRVTLHNVSYIENLDLEINCDILVSKQGDVIPKILEKLSDGISKVVIPTICPSCGEPLRMNITKNTNEPDVKTIMCDNEKCESKVVAKFVHFCSVMGMKGIGGSTIEKLVQSGNIKEFSDLFELNVFDILTLEGFKKRSAEKVIKIIQSNTSKPLNIVIQAWGVHHLGNSVSEILAGQYDNVDDIINVDNSRVFSKLDGIGDGMSQDIITELSSRHDEINRVMGYVSVEQTTMASNKLENMLFCVSGSMSKGKGLVKELIADNGGIVKSSVVKNLDYLIAGEGSGSKSDKATSFGIKIITEEDFLKMI